MWREERSLYTVDCQVFALNTQVDAARSALGCTETRFHAVKNGYHCNGTGLFSVLSLLTQNVVCMQSECVGKLTGDYGRALNGKKKDMPEAPEFRCQSRRNGTKMRLS